MAKIYVDTNRLIDFYRAAGYQYRCDPQSYRNGITAHRLSPLLGDRTDDHFSKRIKDGARHAEEMNLAFSGGAL
jgi:hypothetical protein